MADAERRVEEHETCPSREADVEHRLRKQSRIDAEESRERRKRVKARDARKARESREGRDATGRDAKGRDAKERDAKERSLEAKAPKPRRVQGARSVSSNDETPARNSSRSQESARSKDASRPRDGNARRRRRRQAQELAKRANPDEMSSEELVRLYYESGAKRLRAAIVDRFLADVGDMARMLGSRMPRTVDTEDLCNAGYFGLLRCLDTFDPSKGRSFSSYMRQRVYGSMVDELRAMDWLPRLMRSRLAQRAQAVRILTQEHGRDPSETEIATQLGLSLDAYRRAYPASGSVQRTTLFANTELDLEQIEDAIVGIGPSGRDVHAEPHPLTGMYHQELIERVRELLSETEWRLVDLHYLQGRKLREVAEQLQLSPARICQIHHSVIRRLKERLRGEAFSI
jgi:RNA polymerase sigma factor for flagellar operon FliA